MLYDAIDVKGRVYNYLEWINIKKGINSQIHSSNLIILYDWNTQHNYRNMVLEVPIRYLEWDFICVAGVIDRDLLCRADILGLVDY